MGETRQGRCDEITQDEHRRDQTGAGETRQGRDKRRRGKGKREDEVGAHLLLHLVARGECTLDLRSLDSSEGGQEDKI